jgi:hypothetical protein
MDVPATKNQRLHEEFCMNSLKRSWRILLLDVFAALAPILAALGLYLLLRLSETWADATADIPVGAFVKILLGAGFS